MTHTEARLLLDKFYAGLTTVAEESALSRWLEAEDCPAEFRADRDVMRTLAVTGPAPLPEGLEARLGAALRTAGEAPARRRPLHRWRLRVGAAAASVASVAAVVAVVMVHVPRATVYTDTCATAQEAAVETQATLLMVADMMRSALDGDDGLADGPCP